MTLEEANRLTAEQREEALAALPYERVEVDGRDALAAVERLRAANRGWPVVVGGDEQLTHIAEALASPWGRSPA